MAGFKRFQLFIIVFILSHALPSVVFAHSKNYFDDLLATYQEYGNKQYMIQEEITQASHVLQAAHIATLAGAPEDVIVALLFHDIGQVGFKEHVGDTDYLHVHHDELGVQWMKKHEFPSDVLDLIRNHTLIKVVLCEEEKDYYEHLSEASRISYHYQKEKFSRPENVQQVNRLKTHPRLEDYKAARRCDEMAKIAALEIHRSSRLNLKSLPDFSFYREMSERVRLGQGNPASDPHWKENVKALHSFMRNNRTQFESMICRTDPVDFTQLKNQFL